MAKNYSSKMHGNDNASVSFGANIVGAVWEVRKTIANLATSRKADEYAPGAIHALRKLCEGEGKDLSIPRQEAEEWQACFMAWYQRVKRHFSEVAARDFLANAEDDFRVILECSSKMPEFMWRKDVDKRFIMVPFENQAARDAADTAADEKHPVKLGSALQEYLKRCVAELVGAEVPPPTKPTNAAVAQTNGLDVRFLQIDQTVSLLIEDFGCFDNPEDVVITAFDLEEVVRSYLSQHSPKVLNKLHFDCESSTFVVRSKDIRALSDVLNVILEMAQDPEEFKKHRA